METTSTLLQAIGFVLLSISVAAVVGLLMARRLDKKRKSSWPQGGYDSIAERGKTRR